MMTHTRLATKLPSERSFGSLFTVLFSVLGVFSYLKGWEKAWVSLAVLSGLIALITLFVPRVLAPFNRAWFLLGNLLGKIVSPMVLGVIFFVLLTPVGLVARMFGRDVLRLKRREVLSYWIDRTPPGPAPETFKNQF